MGWDYNRDGRCGIPQHNSWCAAQPPTDTSTICKDHCGRQNEWMKERTNLNRLKLRSNAVAEDARSICFFLLFLEVQESSECRMAPSQIIRKWRKFRERKTAPHKSELKPRPYPQLCNSFNINSWPPGDLPVNEWGQCLASSRHGPLFWASASKGAQGLLVCWRTKGWPSLCKHHVACEPPSTDSCSGSPLCCWKCWARQECCQAIFFS